MREPARTWRIGELAALAGVTVRTLHHYDDLGLLSPSTRTAGGHRCYSSNDVEQLQRIIMLRSCGLSLDEISAVLTGDVGTNLADLLSTQLRVVEERILQAVALRVRLLGILDGLKQSVPPSIAQILKLIEETSALDRPLTAHRFELLKNERTQELRGMNAEIVAARTQTLQHAWAMLGRDQRIVLAEQRRMTLPTRAEG